MAAESSDARAAMRRARLADFTIAAELYRSTAGGVYRAKHRPSGRTVVLKERLLAAGGGDGGNEVKLFERLPSHPNIVEYLGCFETPPDRLHLVFAWASQGDLQALLRQQRAAGRYLSERQVLQWFVPIAEGVLHLHRHGIVHRDIKSLNILVDNGVPKLCDLGVSRHRSQQTIEMKSFCGTPAYLSPEMAAAQPYTEKTDVWGLGVVLYELLALRLPFSGANLMEISAQIAKGKFAPLPPHVGAPLTSLVRGMLALDASARPAVADVLARASAAHAELLEIRAARQRAKEEEERRRDGAAAAAAAAAAPRPPYAAAAAEPTGGPGADGRRDDRPAPRAPAPAAAPSSEPSPRGGDAPPPPASAGGSEAALSTVSSDRERRLAQRHRERSERADSRPSTGRPSSRASTCSQASTATSSDGAFAHPGVGLRGVGGGGLSEREVQAYVLAQQIAAQFASSELATPSAEAAMLRAQDALANLSIPSTSGGPPLPPMTPALGDEHERPPTGAPPAVRPAGAGAAHRIFR